MVSAPENIRRIFLPWDRPLLGQAVDHLVGSWKGEGPLDLSRQLVVVPTRQSGRRLREAIASRAAVRGRAVFPPRVMAPDGLIAQAGQGAAGRLLSLLAWTEVLAAVDLDSFRDVFPVDPPGRPFSWAYRLAETFAGLQSTLAEAGLRMGDVAASGDPEFPESARWRQLAELSRLHAEKLGALGLQDAQEARIAAAPKPEPLADVDRIVILATPDPLPLSLETIAAHARSLPVEIVVFAPSSQAAAFDGWGRPIPAAWERGVFSLPEFDRRVHLCADPAAQAARLVDTIRGYGASISALGIGVADAEVLAPVTAGLRHAEIPVFDPGGRPHAGDRLGQLLGALSELARDEAFVAVGSLARCPDFMRFLETRAGGGPSGAEFLAELDELRSEHLPPSLSEARRHAPDNRGLAAVAELRGLLVAGTFPENAAQALATIFGARTFDSRQTEDALAIEAAEAWAGVLREVAGAAAHFRGLTIADCWDVALRAYGESTCFDEKQAGAVELQGWLELLWEDAPHLLVAGLNDGSVPDAVVGDPFLPESLRARIGLKTNAARFARDAYLLQALACAREKDGRLDLLLGKTSTAGDPLRPSRLLLRCTDAELPGRIEFLFRQPETARGNPPWRRAWKLDVRTVDPSRRVPSRVNVTAIRAWLDCPFRFYLANVLKLEPVDPAKTELDAMDFGTFCHQALERMGREPALRDCTNAAELKDFLDTALTAAAAARFGADLSLPLVVQLESARQRLSRLAEVQAAERAAGWITVEVERKIAVEVGGLTIGGKVDRIDRHEGTGVVRVLDYKTSDRAAFPDDSHLGRPRRGVAAPAFARFFEGDREWVWKDLQLPLYLRALAPCYGEIAAGYFNLPKSVSGTGIAPWTDWTPALAESAWTCAAGVAAAIRNREFWPPNEEIRAEGDVFAELFHHGAAASVDWEGAGR